jgi:hypothetical protein
MSESSETGETGGKSATGRDKGSHVTQVPLIALFPRYAAMNHAG